MGYSLHQLLYKVIESMPAPFSTIVAEIEFTKESARAFYKYRQYMKDKAINVVKVV